MTKRQLVDGFIDGRLSRRAFIKGLRAAGVSLAAAVTYANILSAEARADAPVVLRRVLGKVPAQGKKGVLNALRQQAKHGGKGRGGGGKGRRSVRDFYTP